MTDLDSFYENLIEFSHTINNQKACLVQENDSFRRANQVLIRSLEQAQMIGCLISGLLPEVASSLSLYMSLLSRKRNLESGQLAPRLDFVQLDMPDIS